MAGLVGWTGWLPRETVPALHLTRPVCKGIFVGSYDDTGPGEAGADKRRVPRLRERAGCRTVAKLNAMSEWTIAQEDPEHFERHRAQDCIIAYCKFPHPAFAGPGLK